MAESDNPQAGPLTIDQYLDAHEAPEGQADEQEEENPVTEPEAETEVEAEADVKDEPEAEADEAPAIYPVDEYGEITISLDDGTQTTLKDLAQGTLRQADYTRKTTELSRERKELESEKERLTAFERQLNEQLASLDEPEPDWQKLAEEDPLGLPLEQIKWQKKQAEKADRRRKAEQVEEQRRQHFMRATADVAVEKFPEWSDPKKFEEGVPRRRKVALDAGFSEAEFSAIVDLRLLPILEKAARWDAGQVKTQAANKMLAKVPKVVKPGAAVSKADREQAERAAKVKRRKNPMSIDEYLDTFDIR